MDKKVVEKVTPKSRFDLAITVIRQVSDDDITNEEKLKLYGLYKQSTIGNCNIEPPNQILDFRGYKKYQQWNKCKGISKDDAMNQYSDFVIKMVDKYGFSE